ncbi:MAG TPA: DegT/DnrJ/EryC1/StrS aminotransferase family protein [Burkholderiales bacterium]|nr:DegT/DnrJ/EryC1/StrS aminotransferase family protein [Burkholderiales bacterium]
MTDDFLPFSRPDISRAAIDEVVQCLESGWITTGPRTRKFEDALAAYLGAEHVLAVSSATAGLHLVLLALELKPGDEVITTPMTFAATLNTIVLAGGTPVLVDVEPHTYNIDMTKLARAVTPRTRAIVPVHFAGLPADLDPLYALAEKNGLRVIEDAAHAIGAVYKGRRVGSSGDTQVFSFHPNKNMTTGEGGCIASRDQALAERAALMRFHGMDREAWDRFGKKGNQHYEIVLPGFKYNMMDIQAALGLHQLPTLDNFIARRTRLALRYRLLLEAWPQWTLPGTPAFAHRHAWHLFAPLINPTAAGMDRDTFMAGMKARNIGTGLHYRAVHLYPYYRERYVFERGDFPIAETISDRVVSLPLFPTMTDAEQDRVIEAMRDLFKTGV